MKTLTKFTAVILLLHSAFNIHNSAFSQNVGISATGVNPHNSAMLDVTSTTKGILIPRMTGTEKYAITSPATGLLIFQTDTVGFWYYDGSKWIPLLSSTSSTSGSTGGWGLSGNGNTSASNFLGTTDNVSLRLKTNDIARVVVDSLGRVGIGTTSPAYKLTVQDTGSTALPFAIYVNGNASGYSPVVRQFRARGTSTPSQVLSGDYLGGIGCYGYDGSGNYSAGVNSILFQAAEDFTSATNHASRMIFYTTTKGAATATERMRIDTNGTIAMGTTSPSQGYRLHVVGDTTQVIAIRADCNGTGLASGYGVFSTLDGANTTNYGVASNVNGLGGATTNYAFKGSVSGGTTNWGIYLSGEDKNYFSGNVGIGISPTQKLHVAGNGLFTGTVTASCGLLVCSDIRYKKDIIPLPNALSNVMKLQGVNYLWKTDEELKKDSITNISFSSLSPLGRAGEGLQLGFIAQDLEKIYPEVVMTDKDGYKSVDYSRLTPILVEAIKEQQKIIGSMQLANENQQKAVGNQQLAIDNQEKTINSALLEIAELKVLVNKLLQQSTTTEAKK